MKDKSAAIFNALEKLIHFGLPLFILLSLSGHNSLFFYGSGVGLVLSYLVLLVYGRFEKKNFYRSLVFVLPFMVGLAYVDAVWQLYYLGELRITTDATHGYFPQSELGLFDADFWLLGVKPFVTPLIFKLSNRNLAVVNGFFVAGYLVVTLFFTVTLTRFFSSLTERVFVFYLLILFFLNQTLICVWLTVAQSEAAAIILTILMLGVYAFAYKHRESKKLQWLIPVVVLTSFFYSFSRDTNMYFLPFLAFFYFFVFKKTSHRIILTVFFVALVVLHNHTMVRAERWKFPLANVLMKRIIPNSYARKVFQQKYHLPGDEVVRPAAKKWASSEFEGKEKIYSLDSGNGDWVSRYGLSSYRSYLLTHPRRVISEWVGHWSFYNQGYWRLGLKSGGRYRLNNLIFSFPGDTSFAFALLAFALGLAFIRENPLISLAMLHAFVIGFVAYHGDAMEVERHYQQASMTMRLSFLILVGLLFGIVKAYLQLENNIAERL